MDFVNADPHYPQYCTHLYCAVARDEISSNPIFRPPPPHSPSSVNTKTVMFIYVAMSPSGPVLLIASWPPGPPGPKVPPFGAVSLLNSQVYATKLNRNN